MAEINAVAKRTRRARRNYQHELSQLESYCRVHLEILIDDAMGPSEVKAGKVRAFEQVIAKMESLAKGLK